MPVIKCRVAGVTHNGRQQIIEKLQGNEPIIVQREPQNPYDPNALAIRVRVEGQSDLAHFPHLGYVPAKLAAQLAADFQIPPVIAGQLVAVTGRREPPNDHSLGLMVEFEIG